MRYFTRAEAVELIEMVFNLDADSPLLVNVTEGPVYDLLLLGPDAEEGEVAATIEAFCDGCGDIDPASYEVREDSDDEGMTCVFVQIRATGYVQ